MTFYPHCIFETTGIAFYVSYIHSTAMCVESMERAWKDNSNHTKYSKLLKSLLINRVLELKLRYVNYFEQQTGVHMLLEYLVLTKW